MNREEKMKNKYFSFDSNKIQVMDDDLEQFDEDKSDCILEYEIKLDRKRKLKLSLSVNNQRQQFHEFVKKNKLSASQAKRIKQVIKQSLDEQLAKLGQQESFQQIEEYEYEESKIEKIQSNQSEQNEKFMDDGAETNFETKYHVENNYEAQQNFQTKFETKYNTEEIDFNQSAEQLFRKQVSEKEVQFEQCFSSIHEIDNFSEEEHNETIHVAHLQQFELKNSYDVDMRQNHQNSQNTLEKDSVHQKDQFSNQQEKRKFFLLQVNLPQSKKKKLPKNQNIFSASPKRINQKKKKQKIEDKKNLKSVQKVPRTNRTKKNLQKQKQLNHKVFYRLNQQQTESFRKKLSNYQKPSDKQIRDERVVSRYKQEHSRKYDHLTPQQKSQIFNKLYVTSTQSSFNKKYDPNQKFKEFQLNEIENIINMSAKKNTPRQSELRRIPNMKSRVYQSPVKMSCNDHCSKFEYEKELSKEKQKKVERQQRIKDQIRSRSNESCSSLKRKIKKNGECLCCHKDRIQKRQKERLKNERKKQRSYTSKTKYSIQKLFPPYNHVSFISDVLEESYNELFPTG